MPQVRAKVVIFLVCQNLNQPESVKMPIFVEIPYYTNAITQLKNRICT